VGSSFKLLLVDMQFSEQNLLNKLSSPSCVLVSFVEDQLAVVCRFMAGYSILTHCPYHAVFVPIPCCLYCYGSVG
jgi:hypothetical protein